MNRLIQEIQLADKYSRLKENGTKESWEEVTERVVGFLRGQMEKQEKHIPDTLWREIRNSMLSMDVLPSMRIVQLAGPALERDNTGCYNCAFTALDSHHAMAELLHIMMQGTGVGFSVESHYTNQWRTVGHRHQYHHPVPFIVEDSSQGWVEAFRYLLDHNLDGIPCEFDYSRIRPAGTPLKTKGGYASGPEHLQKLLDGTQSIILNACGRKLTPFEIHRIATLAGSVVMMGGVRRAAQLSLSDADDDVMRNCKNEMFWERFPELSMANNSAVIQNPEQLESEWSQLANSGTGERGLFNPNGPIPSRRKPAEFGTNPCGEILLRSKQFCNLSIAVARPHDTIKSMSHKVFVATVIGTIQSCLTYFPDLSKEWATNCEEERLLGVDITGALDCPLFIPSESNTHEIIAESLMTLRNVARRTNEYVARVLDINPSVAITCNKPSGNSSQLLDCASGIHPRYAKYYIRRLRIGSRTPLAQHLMKMGVPVYPETGSADLSSADVWVFELPAKAPSGAKTRADFDAISQLEYWKVWKTSWTEHNPSCTIYVEDNEWDRVLEWVKENWGIIGGLSFLPKSNHIYPLAPYEEIKKDEYDSRCNQITWDGGSLSGWAGEQAGSTDAACAGDFCEF